MAIFERPEEPTITSSQRRCRGAMPPEGPQTQLSSCGGTSRPKVECQIPNWQPYLFVSAMITDPRSVVRVVANFPPRKFQQPCADFLMAPGMPGYMCQDCKRWGLHHPSRENSSTLATFDATISLPLPSPSQPTFISSLCRCVVSHMRHHSAAVCLILSWLARCRPGKI